MQSLDFRYSQQGPIDNLNSHINTASIKKT
jgi:hypothetical protein